MAPLPPSQVQPNTKINGERNIREGNLFISETRVEGSIINGKIVYALLVLKKGEEKTPLYPLAGPFVCEFKDVFPSNLPLGLHPIRGTKYHAKLLPRASLPNIPTYRCNPT